MILLDVGMTNAFRLAVACRPPNVALVVILFVVLPDGLSDLNAQLRSEGLFNNRDFPLKCIYLLILLLMLELVRTMMQQIDAEGSKGASQAKQHEIPRAIVFFLAHYDILFTNNSKYNKINI